MTGTLTTLAILPTTDNASDIGSAALSYNDAWFDGTVTIAALSVTTMNTYTFNQSVASGAAPTFVGTNFTGVPDGALTSNVALKNAAATITGSWRFTPATDRPIFDGGIRVLGLTTAVGQIELAGDTAANASDIAFLRMGNGGPFEILTNNGSITPISIASTTGDLTYTGGAFSMTLGATTPLLFDAGSNYNIVSLINSTNLTTNVGMFGGASGDTNLYLMAGTSGGINFRANGSDRMTLSSAGAVLIESTLRWGSGAAIPSSDSVALLAGATFTGTVASSTSVAFTGTTNNLGTITTGVWNAGAVTSSGAGSFTTVVASASGSVFTTDHKVLGAEAGNAILYIWADEGDDIGDRANWTMNTSGVLGLNIGAESDVIKFDVPNSMVTLSVGFSLTIDGSSVIIPYLASSSGTRYVCSTTTGALTDSTSACSGTDADLIASIPSLLARIDALEAELFAARRR